MSNREEARSSAITRRVLAVAVAFAGVSGIASVAAYLWVQATADATMDGNYRFPWMRWMGYSIGPGVAVFVSAMAVLLASLIVARVAVRPNLGGNLMWVAALLAWVASALTIVFWVINTAEPSHNGASMIWPLTIIVGFFAVVCAIFGLVTVALDRRRQRRGDWPPVRWWV